MRLVIAPLMLAVQLMLYYWLWTAIFRHTARSGGLDGRQTVTYAVMALLITRVRWAAQFYSKDSVAVRVREGTIVYWFIRPISPARYYLLRQLGEMGYGAAWAMVGYWVALLANAIDTPASVTRGLVAAASLFLGQMVLYYLGQIVDLGTFWMTSNQGVASIYVFVQSFFSGAYVPLWFMPTWLLTLATWLPFNAGVNVPVSLYIGRIPLREGPVQMILQLSWVLALAAVSRLLWSRASRRVTIQGG